VKIGGVVGKWNDTKKRGGIKRGEGEYLYKPLVRKEIDRYKRRRWRRV